MIKLTKINEVFVRVDADKGILYEIHDRFSFFVPGYKFMPKYRNGIWDGKVKLFNLKSRLFYIGLIKDLVDYANQEEYELDIDPELKNQRNISKENLEKFINYLKIPENKTPRDYQKSAILDALKNRRAGFLSPTSSGKSLIIYIITRFMMSMNKHVLIVVPTTNLVSQMTSDFIEYNNGNGLPIHSIMAGVDKSIKKEITISTWQSLIKMPVEWFDRFSCIIGDEAHLYKATSLVKILESCRNSSDRFAFTGTLSDALTDKMQITALFGRFQQVTTTEKLMKDGHISKLNINGIILKYSNDDCKFVRANKKKYQDEISFINAHERRNKFIIKLLNNIKGNTLVLFKRVDTHGVLIYNMLKETVDENTEVYFIAGKTSTEDRENIRKLVDKKTNKRIIIVGSMGTMSTGTSMNKIYNVVFVSPSKSRIATLQSIGRGLRLDGVTNTVTLWDIVDDFRIGSYINFALKHFLLRVKMYDSEKFKYKLINHNLK